MNLASCRGHPISLLCVADCRQETVRSVWLDLLFEQTLKFLGTARAVYSPQRIEHHGSHFVDIIRNRCVTIARAIQELNVLDIHLGFGSGDRLRGTGMQIQYPCSRMAAGKHERQSGIDLSPEKMVNLNEVTCSAAIRTCLVEVPEQKNNGFPGHVPGFHQEVAGGSH